MLSPEYGEKKTRVARKVALWRRSKDEDIQLRATAAYPKPSLQAGQAYHDENETVRCMTYRYVNFNHTKSDAIVHDS